MKIMNNDILKVLKAFFKKFPLGLPEDVTVSPEDFLLLHLWLRGYKIQPIEEEE